MPADLLKFGDGLELDRGAYELRRSGSSLKLERIPMEILLLLVERRGQLVTRDDIIEGVWGKDVHVDTDNSINAAIRKVRQVLKDDPEHPVFVQTVTGKGYRFIAPVVEVVAKSTPVQKRAEADRLVASISGPERPRWRLAWPALSLLVATLLVVVAFRTYVARQHPAFNIAKQKRIMLAVLPFEDISNDPGQEYFNDGLTEEMITQLGGADPESLGVIARTSAMEYKNTRKGVRQIGRELGVDYLLEGSVRRSGDRVRISAQLIQVHDQTDLWAESFERDAHDTLALEITVASTIAGLVEQRLSQPRVLVSRANIRPVDPEAHDLYLKGRYYWNQRTQAAFWKGIESFKQAIEKDPNYARAYAGLADCYILLGPNDVLPANEVYPLAKAAAQKALQLDDALAEAHASLGFVMLLYDWNPAEAEREFRRAIAMDPNYATAHHWYAYDLAALKRYDEAVAEIHKALELDPVSPIINADVAQILIFARRDDEAIVQCQKTVGFAPEFSQAYWYLGLLYEQKGMFDQAFEAFLKSPFGPSDSTQAAEIRAAYRMSGMKGYWRERLAILQRQSKDHYISPFTLAVSYARMGQQDKTLEKLEQAVDQRYPSMVFAQIEPVFASLRSNPRFVALLRRISAGQKTSSTRQSSNRGRLRQTVEESLALGCNLPPAVAASECDKRRDPTTCPTSRGKLSTFALN